jgi:formamidopyrimidine-DNA glycosylase
MPELPEVETFKRYLDSTSLHQRITTVEVRDAYVLKRISARELDARLKGPPLRKTVTGTANICLCAPVMSSGCDCISA